ncbi:MAG: enoyl-CoA hydratase-related protein [Pseudomonadota bacterium]
MITYNFRFPERVGSMSFEFLDYSVDDNVATVRMNRPDVLNALTGPMARELIAALGRAATEARVVVLTGAGRAFSSGADLGSGDLRMEDPQRDAGEALETSFNPLILAMRDLPIPIITAVNGPAAGIASAIAMAGDIIVAARSAYFFQPFCNLGLVPDGGSAYLLARAVGRVRAMELMLLCERYPAEQAHADGLVTRVVDDDALDETVATLAARLVAGPPVALRMTRKLAWAALDQSLDQVLVRERYDQQVASRTADFGEGVAAFLEKRPAEFRGR